MTRAVSGSTGGFEARSSQSVRVATLPRINRDSSRSIGIGAQDRPAGPHPAERLRLAPTSVLPTDELGCPDCDNHYNAFHTFMRVNWWGGRGTIGIRIPFSAMQLSSTPVRFHG